MSLPFFPSWIFQKRWKGWRAGAIDKRVKNSGTGVCLASKKLRLFSLIWWAYIRLRNFIYRHNCLSIFYG
ncbi:DUF2542 family protein [Escherichia coli]